MGGPSPHIRVPPHGLKAKLLLKKDSRASEAATAEAKNSPYPKDDFTSSCALKCKEKGFREVPPLPQVLPSLDWDVLAQKMNEETGREDQEPEEAKPWELFSALNPEKHLLGSLRCGKKQTSRFSPWGVVGSDSWAHH